MSKVRSGQELTPAEQAIRTRVFSQFQNAGGPGGGGEAGGGGSGSRRRMMRPGAADAGRYIVFVMRDGKPVPVHVRTDLTDLDYIEVTSGLTEQDTVLLMPSASLLESQRAMRERFQRMTGGGLPGVQQQTPPSAGTQRPQQR
jgi:hypothetical protein